MQEELVRQAQQGDAEAFDSLARMVGDRCLVQRGLSAHEGRWVALTRSEIIAVGDEPRAVLERAHAAGIEDPILFRVPEDSDTAYFF